MPDMVGKFAGKSLVVVGDAACVWEDLEAFGCKVTHRRGEVAKDGWDFMTINKAVENFPGNIVHAYSNQGGLLMRFIAARRSEYREFDGPRYTHSIDKAAQVRWPWGGQGTSALGGFFVGLMLGYDQIVGCGIPLTDGPHNGEPPWRKSTFTREATSQVDFEINKHWQRMKDFAGGRVKSMSGRTREWLGAPL
jgi:hypothetical protein